MIMIMFILSIAIIDVIIKAVAKVGARHRARGGQSLGAAYPCGEVFVRAEAELRVIDSALSSWLVSMVCALVAVVCFTRNVLASVTATFAMAATAACSLYAITSIFHWHFGLMEVTRLLSILLSLI